MIAAMALSRELLNQCLQIHPISGAIMWDENKAAQLITDYVEQFHKEKFEANAVGAIDMMSRYNALIARYGAIPEYLNRVMPNDRKEGEDVVDTTIRLLDELRARRVLHGGRA